MSEKNEIKIPASKQDLRERYDGFAPRYDFEVLVYEFLGLRKLRKELIKRASGSVLEIATGTGKNFQHYEKNVRLTATDMSRGMLSLAKKKADKLGMNVTYAVIDGEAIAFADGSFDTVVSSLTLCTFTEPVKALQEMARVCKPDGRILLVEHGKSSNGWLARFQDKMAHKHAARLGCWWNRMPLDYVKQAGMKISFTRKVFFGIFHIVEAVP